MLVGGVAAFLAVTAVVELSNGNVGDAAFVVLLTGIVVATLHVGRRSGLRAAVPFFFVALLAFGVLGIATGVMETADEYEDDSDVEPNSGVAAERTTTAPYTVEEFDFDGSDEYDDDSRVYVGGGGCNNDGDQSYDEDDDLDDDGICDEG